MAVAVAGFGGGDGTDAAASGHTAPSSQAEATQPPGELAEVRLAYVQGFGSLPIHVAQTEGFFAAHGLSVEEIPGNDMPLWVQALDDQYDIVMSIPSITMQASVAGIDHVVVSGLARTSTEAPNIPLMTADDEIQTFADLAGKRVGVLNLAGTIAESILFLVEDGGGDPNDVVLVPTPFPAMQDSLEAGLLDAATLAIPFDAALGQVEGYRSLGDPVVAAAAVITGQTDPVNSYFVASRSFAEDNPEVVAGFRAALDDAIEWIVANDDAARALLVEWLGVPAEVTEIANLPLMSTDVTAEDFDVFYTLAKGSGSLTGEPDLASLVWQP